MGLQKATAVVESLDSEFSLIWGLHSEGCQAKGVVLQSGDLTSPEFLLSFIYKREN